MSVWTDLSRYGRLAWSLRSFLRNPISMEEARVAVRQRLAQREANFLQVLERGIFGYPRSPYLPLLKLAGCTLGDVQQMVQKQGLEDTLLALREAGLYVTFEEFKGRTPIVRGGQEIRVEPHDFDNPNLTHYTEAQSGGTTGTGTRMMIDLDDLSTRISSSMVASDAAGLHGAPRGLWIGDLPYWAGMATVLGSARGGHVVERWFSPVTPQDLQVPERYRRATRFIIAMGRFSGVPLPRPEPVPLDQAAVVARWAAEKVRTDGKCVVNTYVSLALRVCLAARDEGIDLTGVTFSGGGEPPTPAKVEPMRRVGAQWLPVYALAEIGILGAGCGHPIDVNDLHFLKDTAALIQHPREVTAAGVSVDAFYFTTLLPTARKVLLNVESDDYGTLETRACGCALERCGFTEHLRNIRSFSKLTSEGMTLLGSDMVHILEDVLPARFGGSSLDYQLLEEEDEQGFTRLNLVIHPRIDIADENQVIETVLEALKEAGTPAETARAMWAQAKTLRVKRMEPLTTARGKLIPLRTSKGSAGR